MSKRTEHGEQVALIQWCAVNVARMPELDLLLAIPNGGHRHKAVAGKLKAEGVRRGIPDLFMPIARNGYYGLFIEMKIPGGHLSPEQVEWREKLETRGYQVVTCYGFEAARDQIKAYLAYETMAEQA